MRRTAIPVEELFAWGKLNGVEFNHVDFKTDITSNDGTFKGAGLFSTSDRNTDGDGAILISVPQDLILSREQVERYAALNRELKMVLDAAGAFGRVSTNPLHGHMLHHRIPG